MDAGLRLHQRSAVAGPLVLLPVLAVAGCAFDTPMSTLTARSDLTGSIVGLYAIITWATAIIGIFVLVALSFIMMRFRDRAGAAVPRQIRGHSLLEISWTIAPALILLIIAIPTIQIIFRTQGAADPKALEVRVRAYQWWWEFRYPSLEVVTANELHVPTGRPIVLVLEGPDVIHSLFVPQLWAKRDVVPGRLNRISFVPNAPGEYWGQCAEFCGISHALMALRVIVDAPETFERWVAGQRAPAAEPADAAAEGRTIFAASACVGCHTIRGVSAGVLGPDLTHFGSRRMLGAGLLPSTPDTVAAWVREPARFKPGVKMPALGLTEAQSRAVATYLLSLK